MGEAIISRNGSTGVGRKTTNGGEIFNDYENNKALGENSHVEGGKTEATGDFSHAQNRKAKATGRHSHAQNYDTLAQGEASTALGVQSKVYQRGGYVEGIQCISGDEAQDSSVDNPTHAEGIHSKAIGFASHAENSSVALGKQCHSEGIAEVNGEASHGEGDATVNSDYSHGEGNAIVNGNYGHGEGYNVEVSGYAAHGQGQNTKAIGQASNAGGEQSEANHRCSDVVGYYLKSGLDFQTVRGKCNKISEDALFVVGNGNSEYDRKNAFEVKLDGSAILQTQGMDENSIVTVGGMYGYAAPFAMAEEALNMASSAESKADEATATANDALSTANGIESGLSGYISSVSGTANEALSKSDEAIGLSNSLSNNIASFGDRLGVVESSFENTIQIQHGEWDGNTIGSTEIDKHPLSALPIGFSIYSNGTSTIIFNKASDSLGCAHSMDSCNMFWRWDSANNYWYEEN